MGINHIVSTGGNGSVTFRLMSDGSVIIGYSDTVAKPAQQIVIHLVDLQHAVLKMSGEDDTSKLQNAIEDQLRQENRNLRCNLGLMSVAVDALSNSLKDYRP